MTLVATPITTAGDTTPVQAMGSLWSAFFGLVFSGSYTTGGEAWDPTPQFPEGIGNILVVDVSGSAGYGFEYDKVNKKLKLFSAANTELAAGAYNAALTADVNLVAQVLAR